MVTRFVVLTFCRLGSRRYSRFGNLRYEPDQKMFLILFKKGEIIAGVCKNIRQQRHRSTLYLILGQAGFRAGDS
jgi:hypothetical protein